jgi:hypothetical protein
VKHLCISYIPEENHSLHRRNKTHRNVIDVMVRDITPMNADLKRPYVASFAAVSIATEISIAFFNVKPPSDSNFF